MTDTYLLGLELIGSLLKIAYLQKSEKGLVLSKLDQITIRPENIEASVASLTDWLKNNLPVDAPVEAVLSLPESYIFLKEITVPKLSGKKLAETIRWEISGTSPVPYENAVVQWKIVSEKDKTYQIAVMVIKEISVHLLYKAITQSGIKLAAIEPSSYAFTRITSVPLEKNTLLVLVEEGETNAVVLKKGIPVFSTSVTTALRSTSYQRHKLEEATTEELAQSVERVITYWQEHSKDMLYQVVLAGEGIKYFGLASAINNFAHIPCIWTKTRDLPDISVNAQSKLAFNRYLIPFAAALRLLTKKPFAGLNFLPNTIQKSVAANDIRQANSRKLLQISLGNLFLLFLLIILYGFLKFQTMAYDVKIAQTKLFVSHHPAQKLLPEIKKTNEEMKMINILMNAQKDTGNRLSQIASLTPADLKFTTISLKDDGSEIWQIKGVGDRNLILAFYNKLKKEAGAKEITMPYSNLEKDQENNFEINLVW